MTKDQYNHLMCRIIEVARKQRYSTRDTAEIKSLEAQIVKLRHAEEIKNARYNGALGDAVMTVKEVVLGQDWSKGLAAVKALEKMKFS